MKELSITKKWGSIIVKSVVGGRKNRATCKVLISLCIILAPWLKAVVRLGHVFQYNSILYADKPN